MAVHASPSGSTIWKMMFNEDKVIPPPMCKHFWNSYYNSLVRHDIVRDRKGTVRLGHCDTNFTQTPEFLYIKIPLKSKKQSWTLPDSNLPDPHLK